MSRKHDIIHELRAAKQGHVKWVMYASALIEGMEMSKDHVPVLGTECAFGKWYYGPGQALNHLPSFKKTEQPHLELHRTYMEVFKLLFGHNEHEGVGFWARLFGRKSDHHESEERQTKAHAEFLLLQNYSRTIVSLLEELENEVAALTEEEVDKLFY